MKYFSLIIKGICKLLIIAFPGTVILLVVSTVSLGGGNADAIFKFMNRLIDW